MLWKAFPASPLPVSYTHLDAALHEAVKDSFNMVSIDGDTSTNDMVAALANGLAGNPEIEEDTAD